MHIRTYVNCFGNIVLRMSSVHCGVSGETADKAILALWKSCVLRDAVPREAKDIFVVCFVSSEKMYSDHEVT